MNGMKHDETFGGSKSKAHEKTESSVFSWDFWIYRLWSRVGLAEKVRISW